MPAKLSPIIYGEKKNIDFSKFNIGNVMKAITYDLEEFGEKGVQGVPVKTSEALKMKKYHEANKNLKDPYFMAGVVKNDLVLVIHSSADPKFEAMSVLVKNYVGLKAQLAKSSAAVVNLDKGDRIIDGASKAQGDKFKTKVQDEDDMDFGGITGNILLCAHGEPKTKPGRVIGVELAGKKPSQICDLLTKNKDKAKRIAKDYSGKITLSGCFTASGGPEKDKQDDAFAKKVKDELSKRGYKKVSVVGMPGPSATARETDGSDRDSHGKVMKRGDKEVWAKSEEMLEAQEKKAVKLRKEIDSMTKKILEGWKKFKGTKEEFVAHPKVKKALGELNAKEKSLDDLKTEIESIKKDMRDTGDSDGKSIKALTGTFGLRVIRHELKSTTS